MIGWALLAALAASAPAEAPRVYGLSIGNNATPVRESDLKPLRYADDDAVRFFELFERVSSRTYLLSVLDAETQRRHPQLVAKATAPSLAALRAAVADLGARLRQDKAEGRSTVLLLFYSGHGSIRPDGEPYLAMLDDDLTQARLFADVVEALPADRVHLILDACNAGAMVDVRGPFDDAVSASGRPVDRAQLAGLIGGRGLARFPHVGAVLAASAGQAAHEWSRISSGVFSHEVYSALTGGGDVNSDRQIEYSELRAFVAAANSKVADPRARPNIRAVPPAADRHAPLFDLRWLPPGPFLVGHVSERNMGRFSVERPDGRRLLDVNLSVGTSYVIALPPGDPGYVRTEASEARLPVGRVGPIRMEDLDFSDRETTDRGALDTELRRGLFGRAYGPGYYRGFVDSESLDSVDFLVDPVVFSADRDAPMSTLRKWAVGTWVTAGVALVAGAVTGGLAIERRSAFDRATQREAADISNQHQGYQAASVASLSAAGGLTALGFLLWYGEDDPGIQTLGQQPGPMGPAPLVTLQWSLP